MIADAGHSLSDLLSDGVTLWAVRLARLPPDEDHPYGHGRFEAVGALLIAILLGSAAVGFGHHAYDGLAAAMAASASAASAVGAAGAGAAGAGHVHGLMTGIPGSIALVAAAVSILSKELLYRATAVVGNRLNSQVLIANAWHHRSDALSSIVALVGIAGARVGFPLLDPIAGLFVAAMVALTGVQLGWDAMKELTDTVDDAVVTRVAELTREVKGVVAVDPKKVRARRMGSDTLVDLRVQTPSYMSASGANQVAETVRWRILESMPEVKEVLVHVTSESKQCPMLASLRSAEAIEADVRAKLRSLACSKPLPGDYVGDKKITTVHKVTVHYLDMQPCVEVLVEVPEFVSVKVRREGEGERERLAGGQGAARNPSLRAMKRTPVPSITCLCPPANTHTLTPNLPSHCLALPGGQAARGPSTRRNRGPRGRLSRRGPPLPRHLRTGALSEGDLHAQRSDHAGVRLRPRAELHFGWPQARDRMRRGRVARWGRGRR